jgi:hypothetical protein
MLKNPMSMKDRLPRQNSAIISSSSSPTSLVYVSAGNCQRGLVEKSGTIRKEMGMHNRSEVVTEQESPCAPPKSIKDRSVSRFNLEIRAYT